MFLWFSHGFPIKTTIFQPDVSLPEDKHGDCAIGSSRHGKPAVYQDYVPLVSNVPAPLEGLSRSATWD